MASQAFGPVLTAALNDDVGSADALLLEIHWHAQLHSVNDVDLQIVLERIH